MKNQNKAFTLVELIVVITILAILGTIAFISLQGYSRDARNGVRISDINNIEKQLEITITKVGTIYQPENKVDITASGAIITFQGEMGEETLNKLSIFNGGLEPSDNSPYTYATTPNLKKYQLLGFLEGGLSYEKNINLINQSYAVDYSQRTGYVIGNPIGIIVDPVTKQPIQNTGTGVDVVTTNTQYEVYLDNRTTGDNTGTGETLKSSLSHVITPNGSCNSILINGNSKGNGVYTIQPTGTGSFSVYCDMINDGGGWTKVVDYNLDSLAGNIINNRDWYQDSNNYIYLYSLRNNKTYTGKYEFKVEAIKGTENKWLHFTQDNSFVTDPNNNDFKIIGGDITFNYPDTNWFGLAIGSYGNINMVSRCPLAFSYGSTTTTTRYTCVISNGSPAFGTGPLIPSYNPVDQIVIWQK